ncbi:hypothetical protein [Streptomyces olivoreticuli]|uniref:hypothetical protein n=1 Tax=Streptomyces olivoreticuli TaxID=68246 RepID=UPI0013C3588D|nr:hypothetical protein [Streptomyces olivoreticuli]
MVHPSTSRIFDAIEIQVAEYSERYPAACLCIDAVEPGELARSPALSLPAARRIALDPEEDPARRDAIWRRLVQLGQQDRAGDPDRMWSLVAMWMLLPGLRRTVGRLARYSRADTQDICSAVLLGALEALHAADPELPGLGDLLWRAASSGGWRLAKAAVREYPVEDLERAGRHRGARLDESADSGKVVHCGVPGSWTETGADTVQREGERLGAVAHRLGLGATVSATRLCTQARTIGHRTPKRAHGRTNRTACRNDPS